MAVTIKVNGVANSLVHKGSGGISAATMPDVCKTPTPGGPVPLPYPNVSQSATLAKGTTTVKADGGNMIAVKGSEFSVSNGDNAGTLGGVKSSTFMKESTWISYSFDVKIQGRNACRLTDKKLQNHGNTADLAGTMLTATPVVEDPEQRCPTCRNATGATHRDKTEAYEDFFNEDERQAFDSIAGEHPDLTGMLPPKAGRYKIATSAKPARDRWEKAKKSKNLAGEYHHPHPLKLGGCPIHQVVLKKPDDPSAKEMVDAVDDRIKAIVNSAIQRRAAI